MLHSFLMYDTKLTPIVSGKSTASILYLHCKSCHIAQNYGCKSTKPLPSNILFYCDINAQSANFFSSKYILRMLGPIVFYHLSYRIPYSGLFSRGKIFTNRVQFVKILPSKCFFSVGTLHNL